MELNILEFMLYVVGSTKYSYEALVIAAVFGGELPVTGVAVSGWLCKENGFILA